MSELYDELGQLTRESEEEMHDEVAQKAILEGEHMVSLEKHPGWLLIKATLEATIEKEKHSLLFASAMDYITKIQSSIRARQELLDFIQIKILESRVLLEESTQTLSPSSR